MGCLHKILIGLICWLLISIALPASLHAQDAIGNMSETGRASNQEIVPPFTICDPPPVCFASAEERQAWAARNRCRFLEDVCSRMTPARAKQGAGQEGPVKGLTGLGRSLYDDPEGTLRRLTVLLGHGVVDTLTRATQCGAHDLGLVIGQNVNPAVILRSAARLSRYGDDLADAGISARRDFGCASFAAGTPVLTARGRISIERIRAGQFVLSRAGQSLLDGPQMVTEIFSRRASSHRVLRTEFDTFALTDEHPLWVQGKGWTQAKDVTEQDVVAGSNGDALVLSNKAVQQPLDVFNFTVSNSASYFVGDGGTWVHNAKCQIVPGGGLVGHEAAGGHLIARHVGKSASELIERLQQEPRLTMASSFPDIATAEYAVSTLIAARKSDIDAFLKGPRHKDEFQFSFPEAIGTTVTKNSSQVLQVKTVVVVLRKDRTSPLGYIVLTGYPTP